MRKKIIYNLILTFVFFSACTESYDVELDSSYNRLVVQGSISNELKQHQVILSKSADYFANKPATKVTDAIVTLSDGENIFILTEVEQGVYETDSIAGEIGKTYTLSIDTEGNSYKASSYLNYCPPIDSINFGYYDFSDYDIVDSSVFVLLNALEPETPDNYYLWKIYRNGVLETDTISELYFSDDLFINGYYMYNAEVGVIPAVNVGDTITLEMQSITEDYFDYLSQVLTVTEWNLGPFGGQPANPNGNIYETIDDGENNNNPVGFFLAYSNYQITDTIPEKEEWIELKWWE